MSTATQKGGKKFSTSLIVGLLLVPLSAVAAVALVNPDASAEDGAAAEAVVAGVRTTTGVEEIVIPEIASTDDLEEACGEQGLALVMKEADETISALEQAALDSLRAICRAEGMELPGPPAPEAVVETVTVVAGPASTDDGGETVAVDDAAAEFEAEYAATVTYINKAIDDGARGEMIDKAERLVGDAATLADGGDYASGMNKLSEARQAADDAERRHHDDDDDDDDDHDEDDEDEHDEEDDHDEEDEEDEDDD